MDIVNTKKSVHASMCRKKMEIFFKNSPLQIQAKHVEENMYVWEEVKQLKDKINQMENQIKMSVQGSKT